MSDPEIHPENEQLHVGPALAEFTECHHQFVGQLHGALYLPELLQSAARARAMAGGLLKMFSTGLLAHHADEERELFPAVQRAALAGEERADVDEMVERLVREHRDIGERWKRIEPQVAEAAEGRIPVIDPSLMDDIVHHFFEHVHFEEHHFLPVAQAILQRDGAQLQALGLALHKRHTGVTG